MGWPARGQGAARKQPEPDARLAAIAGDSPGWHPWRSSAGRWWAVRQGRDWAPPGAPPEWARTVDGDTPDELRAALAAQEALGGRAR